MTSRVDDLKIATNVKPCLVAALFKAGLIREGY
jgi:hypothetical protein